MFKSIDEQMEKAGFDNVKGQISIVKNFSPLPVTSLKIDLENVNHFDIDVLIEELKSKKEILEKDYNSLFRVKKAV